MAGRQAQAGVKEGAFDRGAQRRGGGRQDPDVGHQVRQRDLRGAGHRVARADHQAEFFVVELVVVHRDAGDGRHVGAGQAADDDVQVAGGKRGQQLGGRAFAYRDLDAGMVGHEAGDGFGQQLGGRRDQGAHHHVAAGAAQYGVDVVGHVADLGHHGVDAAAQDHGQFGRGDAAVGAFEQRCAEEGFEVVDGLGDGGLRQVQFAGGAGQRAARQHAFEDLQLMQLQLVAERVGRNAEVRHPCSRPGVWPGAIVLFPG
ncbi:hypothetical protein D3C71_1348300 [compost metagenome]